MTTAGAGPRAFPLRAVVLQVESLEGFATGLYSAEATQLLGRSALCIKTNPLCWNVWIATA